ncbi:hypothetical protein AOLI_G00233260 [Acnodon oligacanthus]
MWCTRKKRIRGQMERWRDGGMEKSLLLLLYTATWAVTASDGFNIDVTDPERFSGSEEGFFGYRVLQYQSDSDKQIIVSAPLTRSTNEKASGAIYSCTPNTANCTLLYQQDSSDARFFGMSMAARSPPSAGLTSCSPSLTHDCDGNSYVSGVCYHFNSRLDPIVNNTMVAFQECQKKGNLVFLFDGSSSMSLSDFNKNKEFIWNITTQLKNSSIQFAAVQFSAVPRTVFTFSDYMDGTAKKKLDEEEHMKDLTNTHQAIEYVLVNLFNKVSSGADPGARKALVIITDGTPTDFNTKDVLKRCEDQHITRFVIGKCVTTMDPAELDPIKSTLQNQGAVIGSHEQLLHDMIQQLTLLVRVQSEGAQPASVSAAATLVLASSPPSTDPNPVWVDAVVANPERYAGDPETCRGFLLQCSLVFEMQPSWFPTERSKVAYMISLLTGRALAWATSLRELNSPDTASGESFIKAMWVTFHITIGGRPFPKGLNGRFKDALATQELPSTLEGLYDVCIRLDTHMHQTDFNQRGGSHTPASNPARQPPSRDLLEPIQLGAVIDSGAAENFLDITLAAELGLPFDPLERPLPVMAIDGRSLGSGPITHWTGLLTLRVGNVDIKKLQKFSSDPKESYTFQIDDYSGLGGLLDKLQNKIYNIEGDQSGGHRERTKELSQSGFSAVYDKDVLVLGAVGSNEWRGMLYEVGSTEIEIKDPKLNHDSYMGYSTAVGHRGGVSLLFSGAPRSNYNGQVTLFRKRNTWDVTTRVKGEQVGSYFGASLCLLDMDLDGDTDFLVVGAPLYYQAEPQREGRMYVYRLTSEMELEKVLEVADCVQGRFAATVTSVADLNGDELQDIAVGAPLEDDGKGAVYIYLGNQTQGVRPNYSQRILARTISENLQQFGVAIDGVMDMEGDGLTDIAVGARGTVEPSHKKTNKKFRTFMARPVLSVSAHLSFSPSEISLDNFDCVAQTDNSIEAVALSACFSVAEKTQSTGAVSRGLNVSYELRADTARTWSSRAFFLPRDKTSRNLLNSVLLDSHYSCFNHTVYMPNCVKDTVSPLLIWLNFSQAEQQPSSSSAVINIDSRTTANVEIPFQRNCGNVSCVADLQLDFNFLNETLLVVDQSYFIITVSLLNKGDDSFNTSVELHYPEGLSLSKFDTIKASRRTLSSCGDRDDGALDKTTCSISLPVYRAGTSALFQATFRISGSYKWSDTMKMTLVASSSNSGNQTDGTVTKTLPVQFGVDVAVNLEQCVTYLNFSLDDKGPKPVDIVYMVRNLGLKGLPVSVKFIMPSQIGQNFILERHTITVPQNLTGCSMRMEKSPALCLKQMSCVKYECPSFCLEREFAVKFELKAQLTYLNPQRYTGKWSLHKFSLENGFSSFAELDFDRRRYRQMSNGPQDDATKFHQAQVSVRAELVIPPDRIFIVCSGVAGGLLLLNIVSVLLWKFGFFKRKKYEVARAKLERRRMQVQFLKSTKINDD